MRKMMIAIVNKGDASKVMAAARSAGATGGTVTSAAGTASNSILAALGLGDSKKEVLYSMIPAELEENIRNSILNSVKTKGVLSFLPSGTEVDMDSCEWVMIQVICEKGYAEDVMAVARKEGATGGSIIHAHGTAKEDDVKFFGYPIVSEKDMLVIVDKKENAERIENAISNLEILKQKGKAIIFTIPVSSFVTFS